MDKLLVSLMKRLSVLVKLEESHPFVVFSYFIISVTPSVNTLASSNDFMIFVISFISSFEMNKVNPCPALASPFLLIFLSNLFIADIYYCR